MSHARHPVGASVRSGRARRPEPTVLEGRDVRLEPLDPARHGDGLFDALGGPGRETLWLYLPDTPPRDRHEFDELLTRMATSGDRLPFAILDPRSGTACGWASYLRIEPDHRVVEVGYILYGPGLQRTRGATEAMYLMARHAFDDLGYRRYEWKCDALNAASRRAALRLGFTFEGIFRQHLIVKGRNRDTAWYSMLDSEWPDRKARIERWLAPDNFDDRGEQRTSLSESTGGQEIRRKGDEGASGT
jgi:RimJ/RimL family protein N-acetyltransferase